MASIKLLENIFLLFSFCVPQNLSMRILNVKEYFFYIDRFKYYTCVIALLIVFSASVFLYNYSSIYYL